MHPSRAQRYDDTLDFKSVRANWKTITDANHALRIAAGVEADYEDTQFTVILAALAMFGQAIGGPTTFRMAGLDRDRDVAKRFRSWLANVLLQRMNHF